MFSVDISKEDEEKLISALVGFVVRVCEKGNSATEAELSILPKIAELILSVNC